MNFLQNKINYSPNELRKLFIYILGFYVLFQPDLSIILPILKTSVILSFFSCSILWCFRHQLYNIIISNKNMIYIIILCLINLYTLIPTLINNINLINNFNSITFH